MHGLEFMPRDSEREIVKTLTAFGHSHHEIAQYLEISRMTLEKHFDRELKVGKIELSLKCGSFLLETAMNENAELKERMGAARYILSRKCGWTEQMLQDSSIDTMANVIREGMTAVSASLQKERKDAQNDKDVDSERAATK